MIFVHIYKLELEYKIVNTINIGIRINIGILNTELTSGLELWQIYQG